MRIRQDANKALPKPRSATDYTQEELQQLDLELQRQGYTKQPQPETISQSIAYEIARGSVAGRPDYSSRIRVFLKENNCSADMAGTVLKSDYHHGLGFPAETGIEATTIQQFLKKKNNPPQKDRLSALIDFFRPRH